VQARIPRARILSRILTTRIPSRILSRILTTRKDPLEDPHNKDPFKDPRRKE
jgi:hypothetical protein